MISKFIQNFDIFSQSIQFNSAKQSQRKRTCVGGFLSISVVVVTLTYFVFLNYEYANNLMPPNYRSQSFVTNDNIDISISNDLLAFQFSQFQGNLTLDDLEAKENKVYLTYFAFYREKTSTSLKRLKLYFSNCQNPLLKGYKCLDLSNLPSKILTTGNTNQIFRDISISIYRCHDLDAYKTTVPENCASKQEISDYLGNFNNLLKIKLFTSQFNTTSKSMETNFKNQNMFVSKVDRKLAEFRAQKHTTKVRDGFLIQNEEEYASPISFISNFSTTGPQVDSSSNPVIYNSIIQILYGVDETVQYIDIQYPTYPEVLSLCNSTLALLMCLGFFGRQMAQQIIKQELFILTLQNIYKGTFQKIIKDNNLQDYNSLVQLGGENDSCQTQTCNNENNEEHQGSIFVPSIVAKQQELTLNQSKYLSTMQNEQFKDEIKESITLENSEQSSPQCKLNANKKLYFGKSDMQTFSSSQNRKMNGLKYFREQNLSRKNDSEYQSIQKGIQALNTQTNKLQNSLAISKTEDMTMRPKVISGVSQRIDNHKLSKQVENKLFNLTQFRSFNQIIQMVFNKKKHMETKGINEIAIEQIQNQVANSLDFINFYKDMLFLKKAIMILMSKEQLAALEIVGCTDAYLQNKQNQSKFHQSLNNFLLTYLFTFQNQKDENKSNHFEEQLTISQSEELKAEQIQKFIHRCINTQNLSSVDQRIFQSLI